MIQSSQLVELALKRDVEAPAIARSAVLGRCEDFELAPSICHTVVLLVSEIVSNAVVHSAGPADAPIVLSIAVAEDLIHISVTDAGEGFTPEPRNPGSAYGGYGLYLLEKAASRWGVDGVGGTRVWFELQTAPARTRV